MKSVLFYNCCLAVSILEKASELNRGAKEMAANAKRLKNLNSKGKVVTVTTSSFVPVATEPAFKLGKEGFLAPDESFVFQVDCDGWDDCEKAKYEFVLTLERPLKRLVLLLPRS